MLRGTNPFLYSHHHGGVFHNTTTWSKLLERRGGVQTSRSPVRNWEKHSLRISLAMITVGFSEKNCKYYYEQYVYKLKLKIQITNSQYKRTTPSQHISKQKHQNTRKNLIDKFPISSHGVRLNACIRSIDKTSIQGSPLPFQVRLSSFRADMSVYSLSSYLRSEFLQHLDAILRYLTECN